MKGLLVGSLVRSSLLCLVRTPSMGVALSLLLAPVPLVVAEMGALPMSLPVAHTVYVCRSYVPCCLLLCLPPLILRNLILLYR